MRKLAILMVVMALMACATIPSKPSPLTPQQDFLMKAQQVYIAQTNDYIAMTKLPNPTADQVKVMKVKYDLLNELEPLIKLYRATVIAGGIPDAATEQQINNILNSLGGKL